MAGEFTEASAISLPFNVPDDWQTPILDDCCEFIRDGDWIELKDQGGSDYRLLQISNIGHGEFRETGNYRWITKETFERLRCTEIEDGDVLVARMPEPTGRAWYVKGLHWPSITAVDVAIIRTMPDRLDARYLSYFLNSRLCLGVIDSLTTGTTRRRIRRADIRRLRVPKPLITEQRAIACILGALDDKIELNRRMNETLEATARAIFKSWFVDFGPVRAKAEGRQPQGLGPDTAALFPDSFQDSELGEIPEGWNVSTVGAEVRSIRGRSYRSKELAESTTALVTLKSINRGGGYRPDGLKAFTGEYKPEQIVKPGELVVAQTYVTQAAAVIGKPAIVLPSSDYSTLVASLDLSIVRPKGEDISTYFLYCLFLTDDFQAHVYGHTNGTTVLHLSKSGLPSYRFARPSAQAAVAFKRIAEPLFQRLITNEQESHTLAAIRDALLPKLLSGQIRVKDMEGIATDT